MAIALRRPLTARQREVIRLVAEGAPNKEIARRLGISEQGVKAHVSRLLERHGAVNRTELARVTRAWEDADRVQTRAIEDHVDVLAIDAIPNDEQARKQAGRLRARLGEAERWLSPGADPRVIERIAKLTRTLQELDVAIDLAKELPSETASGPLIDLVQRRVTAAKTLAEDLIESLGARADAL